MNVEYVSYGSGDEVLVGSKTIMPAVIDPANMLTVHYGINYSIDSYYFFVSKGDSLKFNLYWDYIGFGGGTGFVPDKYWTSNTTAEWGPCLVFLDAYVY